MLVVAPLLKLVLWYALSGFTVPEKPRYHGTRGFSANNSWKDDDAEEEEEEEEEEEAPEAAKPTVATPALNVSEEMLQLLSGVGELYPFLRAFRHLPPSVCES